MATKKRKAETDVGGKMVVTKKLLLDKKAAEAETKTKAEVKAKTKEEVETKTKGEVEAKTKGEVNMSRKEKVKAMMAKYTAGLDAGMKGSNPNGDQEVVAKEPRTPPRDKRLSGILKKEGGASPSRSLSSNHPHDSSSSFLFS